MIAAAILAQVFALPGPQMRGISTPRTKTRSRGPRTWSTRHLEAVSPLVFTGELFDKAYEFSAMRAKEKSMVGRRGLLRGLFGFAA